MNCPKCKKEMKLGRHYETRDDRNDKKYDHKTYWCEEDDVWITVEIPKETK